MFIRDCNHGHHPPDRRGAELLKNELQRLKSVDRHAVIQAIAEARAQGDLSENAEYEAAKDKQGFIEGRIKELESKLAAAQVIDPSTARRRRQGRLRRDGRPRRRRQRRQGHLPDRRRRRGRPEAGTDLDQLPDRAALIGKQAGDVAEVQAPGGVRYWESSRSATPDAARRASPRRLGAAPTRAAAAAGLWAGWLLCVALLATPTAFAVLARRGGRVVARVLAVEAYSSLALGSSLLLFERLARAAQRAGQGSNSAPHGLALGALFCTVAGYFGLQPLMAAARTGQGALRLRPAARGVRGLLPREALLVLALALARRAGAAAQSAAFFLTLVSRRLARLIVPPGVTRSLPKHLDLLDRRAVVAALRELHQLDDARPRLAVVALDLLLRRDRPPQHQQLADVLHRRGVQAVGQLGQHASRAARSSENMRTLIRPCGVQRRVDLLDDGRRQPSPPIITTGSRWWAPERCSLRSAGVSWIAGMPALSTAEEDR